MNKFISKLLNLALGASLTLAFAPFNIWLLAFISPALFLFTLVDVDPKQAFWCGWFYGLGFFGSGISWIYISIYVYGHASVLLAFGITALLIMFLALFFAAHGYLVNKLSTLNFFRVKASKANIQLTYSSSSGVYLLFSISWVFFEWLRSSVLTGFPWLLLGYSQLSTPLRALAPIFGVYGVSLAVALTASVMAIFLTAISKKQWRLSKQQYLLIVVSLIVWLIGMSLKSKQWTSPVGPPIKVSLIQGNISQEAKWDRSQTLLILDKYHHLTRQHWDSDLIVWSEAAIPMFAWQAKSFIDRITAEAVLHQSAIITGVPIEDIATNRYYNGAITLGKDQSVYLKRHLVPFGEYPFLGSITQALMTKMNIPMSEFTPGAKKQPNFVVNGLVIAPTICYEIAYLNEVLDFFPQAHLLLNISDDSWFGRSIAASQQLEIAQMRSLETGRYQLVVSNTGVTAIINPDGTIQKILPQFKSAVLTGVVRAVEGSTPLIKIITKLR